MKALIEFDLSHDSEDKYDWETFLKMHNYRRAIEEIEVLMRNHRKYDAEFTAEIVRQAIAENMTDE